MHSIAVHLGEKICQIQPCLHRFTVLDFTNQFLGYLKIIDFKKILEKSNFYVNANFY